ncbi:MAG: carbamoyltransferase HypF [Candidatus Thorarchaeota archaeon]
MNSRAAVHINGIVQGVGFRPFVYRIAKELSLLGYVLNLGDAGVRIIVEGEKDCIERLLNQIKSNPPSISTIDTLDIEWEEPDGSFTDFRIEKSSMSRNEDSEPIIPPDIAICQECITELTDAASRWHQYPFTSCAACGPRYSTITDLPYDRPNTTMFEFPLCDTCNTGYTDPLNRRYHAQTTACEKCGPLYRLLGADGVEINKDSPIQETVDRIRTGSVIAVQGIGGTHLVTKTSDSAAIKELRKRKKRSQRPFAIMVRDISVLKQNFDLTSEEMALLESWRRPIVLVRRKRDIVSNVINVIPDDSIDLIAPGLDTVGTMLPYASLHHLLFQHSEETAFVVTSANPTGVPMYIESDVIRSELADIADYFLVHNRRIHQRADDSVIKFVTPTNPVFIRRARGYVPEPLQLVGALKKLRVLAVGPEEKTTASILKSGRVYTSQHIGDTDRIENIQFLSDSIEHLIHLIGVSKFDGIACDFHPEFLSTEMAEQRSVDSDIPLHRVQHHHSHLASLLVDHKIPVDTRIVCITADGYGYGLDGSAWGGEVLEGDANSFTNVGGIKQSLHPGGDLSAKYAVRPLLGILRNHMDVSEILSLVGNVPIGPDTTATDSSLAMLMLAVDQDINTVRSSSAGRFLDAVALTLGICSANTYDGECPMKLEAISKETDLKIVPKYIADGKRTKLDTADLLLQVVDLRMNGTHIPHIAYAAQWHLGLALAEIAIEAAKAGDNQYIGFSGGVALNTIITRSVVKCIEEAGYTPLLHRNVPPGDGGISIGQVAVAAARVQESM